MTDQKDRTPRRDAGEPESELTYGGDWLVAQAVDDWGIEQIYGLTEKHEQAAIDHIETPTVTWIRGQCRKLMNGDHKIPN